MLQSFTSPRPAAAHRGPSDDLPLPSTTTVARTRRGPPLDRVPVRLRAAAGSHAVFGRAVRGHAVRGHALSGLPASGWPRQAGRAGPRCGRGLFTEAPDQGADAGRAGGAIHPPARLSPGAGALRARHRQPERDRVRRERPAVCQRDAQLHARRRRQRPARSRQPHQRAREHEGRRPVRPPLGLRRQARAAALRAAARRAQHPDDGDARATTFSSTPTRTATASRRRRSSSTAAPAAAGTSSISRAGSCGGSTTGSTAPTTPSASDGRPAESSGSRPGPTTASGG